MLRKCLRCGLEFEGRPDATLCARCARESQASTHIRDRVCRQCGRVFPGGPRAWYCPECRAEREKVRNRQRKRSGPARPLGSTDFCVICGRPYTVTGGLQKYCPACRDEALRKVDREQSIAWNRTHIDKDVKREMRHAATAQIPCVICGKLFTPSYSSKTCSPECSAELHRRQAAAYDSSHRAERRKARRDALRSKIAAMTPEELSAYREKINARSRKNYALRQAARKEPPMPIYTVTFRGRAHDLQAASATEAVDLLAHTMVDDHILIPVELDLVRLDPETRGLCWAECSARYSAWGLPDEPITSIRKDLKK